MKLVRLNLVRFLLGFLALSILIWRGCGSGERSGFKVELNAERTRLEVTARIAEDPEFQLFAVSPHGAEFSVFGEVTRTRTGLIFTPSLPLPVHEQYRLQWTTASGRKQIVITGELGVSAAASAPEVTMLPQAELPANALKLYLHFTQPMEQGVFLEHLRLTDDSGKEVIGPFRETELWSPDGKRLTLWFHPGRQKSGVNLNEEEGPVLAEGRSYTLHVGGAWRSEKGVAIGEEVTFPMTVGKPDHELPDPARWKLELPRPGSLEPIKIIFDEPLDTAMLASALKVYRQGADDNLTLSVIVDEAGLTWSGTPGMNWTAGDYELRIDPLLEDLAGNSLTKPFEVDLMDKNSPSRPGIKSRRFVLR